MMIIVVIDRTSVQKIGLVFWSLIVIDAILIIDIVIIRNET